MFDPKNPPKFDDMINQIICGDCLDVMKHIQDKSVDLVLTDPPYGIGYDKLAAEKGGQQYGKAAAQKKQYLYTDWDIEPEKVYFDEMLRVGGNQIIFGGEHLCLNLPKSRGWIVWDKKTGSNNFSDCELAWSSFDKPLKRYEFMWNGMLQEDMKEKENRWHPTQKPSELFSRILRDYSKEDDLIFDPFGGSGTTGVVSNAIGRRSILFEIDAEYVRLCIDRLNGRYGDYERFYEPE